MMDGATPQTPDSTPAPSPQDANWDAFVQKNAQQPQSPQPVNDPKWNDLVQHYANPTPQPEPAPTFSELGQKLAQPIVDMAVNSFLPKPQEPVQQTEQEKAVDKDWQQFRGSDSYKEGAQNFMNLVSDAVIKPAAQTYMRQIDLANQAWQQAVVSEAPKDEYGNQLPETPDQAIDRTMKLMTAPFLSAAAAIGLTPTIQETVTDPLGKALFPNDPQAQKDYSEGLAQNIALLPLQAEGMRGPEATAPSIQIRNAVRAGVFDGEDSYFNEHGTSANVTPQPKAIEVPAGPDIHDVAHQVAPGTIDTWRRLQATQAQLRSELDDLTTERTKTLDDQIRAIQDAKQGGYGKLQALIAKKDEIVAQGDTPEMAEKRLQMQENDYKMRDLSPAVSEAYRKAQEQMPLENKPEMVENDEHLRENSTEEQSKSTETPHEPQKAEPVVSIADDISKNLVALGRPADEAEASGTVVARMYQYFSDIYGGTKGTAQDWYDREAPKLATAAEPAKVLNQRAMGKIKLATNAARALITMTRKANASTFVHESAHHFLDMMDRFSKEDGAPQALLDDMQKIREWTGLSEKEVSTPSQKAAYTRAQEKFARGFERYLMEGIAPSHDLVDVFSKFKKWLTDIYQSVSLIPNQKGGINPNIRDFFDRVMTRNPEKSIVAPEMEPHRALADIHEADAATTTAERAPEVADTIREEMDSSAQTQDKEAYNVAKSGEASGSARAAELARTTEQPQSVAAPKESAAISEGGTKTASEGGGSRAKAYTAVPRKPLSLVDFLKKIGGLKDKGGDVLASLGKMDRKLIRKNAGKDYETAALSATEAGYFEERPSISDFLAKIHEDINGEPQYSSRDANEVANYHDALARNAETDRLVDQFGIDTKDKTSDQIWNEIADHMSQAQQAKEAEEMASEAQAAYDKMEDHDLAPDEATPRTLEDLENERRQENAARDAAKGKSGIEQSGQFASVAEHGEEGARQIGSGSESSGRTSETGPEPTGADADNERSAGYTEGERTDSHAQPAGSEPHFIDKSGRFRLDKFNTSHDAMAALKEMVAKNNDFLEERSGTDAYKQAQLIHANKQLLAQLAEQFVKLRQAATGSPEDMAAYLRVSEQMQIAGRIRAELQADWGHAGHALQEVTRTDHVENVEALVQQVTGKTLFQLEQEAKLMEQQPTPEAKSQFADDMRSGRWRKFEDGTLGYFRNNILSNPITHAAYLTGNYVWAWTRMLAVKTVAASLGVAREAIAGNPVERVHFGEIPVALAAMHKGMADALNVAAAALRSGVPMMRGQVGPVVRMAMDDIFGKLSERQLLKFSPDELNLLRIAKAEVAAKNVKLGDINPTFAINTTLPGAAEQKSAFPAIHAYLENMATGGYREYKPSLPGQVGRVLTVPERSLAAIHTISYAMNFEPEIASRAYQSGMALGLKGDDLNIHIAKFTQNPPIDAMEEAHYKALEAVFMNRPTYRSLQDHITGILNNDIPVVRVITQTAVPFVQIGMNILDEGFMETTPLGFIKQSVRDDLSGKNGIIARDAAAAKMIMGSSVGMATFGLAATGALTGGGPSDYRKRAVLEATGWKAYSLKVGDLYIPYKKWLGPMGPLIGACADLQEVNHLLSEGDTTNAVKAISAGFAENIADESWMNGLSNLMQAATHGESTWKYIQNVATGFVPYSAALNQLAKWTDPTARDIRSNGPENLWGLLPKVQARIPGISTLLPAKVDVFGDPMPSGTMLSISHATNDPIIQKLSSLDIGLSQASNNIMGIRLNNEQYNDFAVTSGVLIKQQLSWVLQEDGFDQLSKSAKIKEISSVVKQARKAAQQDILFRNPEIMDKAVQNKEKAELQ